MKVRYTTVNGKVIAEKRNGVRSFYVADSLGSTVALIDNTQTITDTFEYWPYGEVRTKTGTNPTPLKFVGTQGYFTDSSSKTYVRARTLDTQKGTWTTKDLLRSLGDYSTFNYCFSNPINHSDRSGLSPKDCCDSEGKPLTCRQLCQKFIHMPGRPRLTGGASVICCEEKKCICRFPATNQFPGEGICPGLDFCIEFHEYQHFADVECPPHWGLHLGFVIDPSNQEERECQERTRSVRCMKQHRNRASPACKQWIDSLIKLDEEWMKTNC